MDDDVMMPQEVKQISPWAVSALLLLVVVIALFVFYLLMLPAGIRRANSKNNQEMISYTEKLDAAKELLLNSDCSISEIAEQLNYANTQNFIRFFSKYENTTPGRYRKEHKKEDSASESDNKQDPE